MIQSMKLPVHSMMSGAKILSNVNISPYIIDSNVMMKIKRDNAMKFATYLTELLFLVDSDHHKLTLRLKPDLNLILVFIIMFGHRVSH